MVRPDSPGMEWYEAPDSWWALDDDGEPEPCADEILTVAGGTVWWSAATPDDED